MRACGPSPVLSLPAPFLGAGRAEGGVRRGRLLPAGRSRGGLARRPWRGPSRWTACARGLQQKEAALSGRPGRPAPPPPPAPFPQHAAGPAAGCLGAATVEKVKGAGGRHGRANAGAARPRHSLGHRKAHGGAGPRRHGNCAARLEGGEGAGLEAPSPPLQPSLSTNQFVVTLQAPPLPCSALPTRRGGREEMGSSGWRGVRGVSQSARPYHGKPRPLPGPAPPQCPSPTALLLIHPKSRVSPTHLYLIPYSPALPPPHPLLTPLLSPMFPSFPPQYIKLGISLPSSYSWVTHA